MLRIKFSSPLIALIATCGIAGAAIGQNAYAADLMERPGGGGGHSPAPGGGGHPGGGGGFGGGGGGHSPAPSPGGGFGGGHGPAPGGNPGYHPPAPTPGGGFGGGGHGGGHNPGPAPGGNPGYHPPAPTPGGNPGYHPPAPTPGGNPGYHPPAPIPGGGHGPTPGGNPGYHPPAPTPGGGFGGGGHGGGHNPGPAPGGNPGYHPPAPTPGGNPGYHPPAPIPGGGHTGGGYPGGGFPGNHGDHGNYGNPGGYHGGMPVGHAHGPGYSYGHDNHGNIVSPVYHDHIDLGRRRMDDMRRDVRVRTWVDQRGLEFRNHYHPVLINHNDRFVRYHDDYRERYRPWWNEGFYGGCYWGFHPFYDIDTYFYDPMVYWFYNNDADDYYYRTWYGADYDRYPVFRTHYRYVRAFYPTEEFRDMNLGISALGIDTQARYLQTSTVFGDRLAEELKARGGNDLDEQSVVVDHYQILPDDKGVVVEGFVDQDDVQFAFKAIQNFSDPDSTTVFTAAADEDVSSDRVDQLRQLNTQIEDMGGVAEGDEANDGTVTAPSDDDQNSGAHAPADSDPSNADDGQTSQWDDQNSPA